MRRWSWPTGGGGLGGLTMSEDGGLEEVEEPFRAAASCAWRWAKGTSSAFNSTCRSSSCACNRWEFGQEGVASALIAANSTSHGISYNTPVNRHRTCTQSRERHLVDSQFRQTDPGGIIPG